MIDQSTADYCADTIRRHDNDRYLISLFAPAARRPALWALYAFNLEVARTRETVSEPALGDIRLQWWRDALDAAAAGQAPQAPVAQALEALLAEHPLDRAALGGLIDARERDLDDEPPPDMAALETYAEASGGALAVLTLAVLGGGGDAAQRSAHHAGTAYALAGLLRALPALARSGRIVLPAAVLAEAGLAPGQVSDRARQAKETGIGGRLAPAVRGVADTARRHLEAARRERGAVPAAARSALLPAALAAHDLARLARCGYDPFDGRLARRGVGRPLTVARAAMLRRY